MRHYTHGFFPGLYIILEQELQLRSDVPEGDLFFSSISINGFISALQCSRKVFNQTCAQCIIEIIKNPTTK